MIEKKEKRKTAGRPQIWFSRCVSIKVPEEDLDLLKSIALGMHRNPELREKFRNVLKNGAETT